MLTPFKKLSLALFGIAVVLTGCDSGETIGASGTVTLIKEQGVNFSDGALQANGNFRDSDLIARVSGDALSLVTGGSSPTENRPINWFVGGGGVMRRFESLAAVPTVAPTPDMTTPNLTAKTGHGFVVQTSQATWTRGWIAAADGTSVTIEFEPLANPTSAE